MYLYKLKMFINLEIFNNEIHVFINTISMQPSKPVCVCVYVCACESFLPCCAAVTIPPLHEFSIELYQTIEKLNMTTRLCGSLARICCAYLHTFSVFSF